MWKDYVLSFCKVKSHKSSSRCILLHLLPTYLTASRKIEATNVIEDQALIFNCNCVFLVLHLNDAFQYHKFLNSRPPAPCLLETFLLIQQTNSIRLRFRIDQICEILSERLYPLESPSHLTMATS